MEQKLTLEYMLPQIKAQIFHMDSQLGHIQSIIKRQLTETRLFDDVATFVFNYESKSSLTKNKKSSSILTEVQEDEDQGSRPNSQLKKEKQNQEKVKKSMVI